MTVLALDVGSSSVKAAVLRGPKPLGQIVRESYPSRFSPGRAEVDPNQIERAIARAVKALGPRARSADAIAIGNMSPSWVAMDARGRAITPVVTHQDRRSVEVARQLERDLGKDRILRIAGNRPFPGGISSTTCAHFVRHERTLMRRCDLVGHLNTYLHRRLTGARVTDPSNASFMGMYETVKQGGWNEELRDAVGAKPGWLPEIRPSDAVGGVVRGGLWGLRDGAPVAVGMIDTSAAMLLAGPRAGQMLNVAGSTDVLAVCTKTPHPHERLLTRALGVGKTWMAVSTLAAGGASLHWAKEQFFPDISPAQFRKLLARLARTPIAGDVRFDPYLAGDRMSIDQRTASFTGLTLATTRDQLLSAVIESLAHASAARLPLLKQACKSIRRHVTISGGVTDSTDDILHRNWPGRWTFHHEEEATVRGLGLLFS